ncbi:hypothetical protein [Variovorax sp. PAMC 28711]|uniref:hypothetical protein n=1 Tax=Variovorax sp. PAMC 28711 TaxID=1795631 RepID=UPI0012E8A30C|nr:hypothetical protein [Variovorax sp. PAMC 28711]
MLIRPPEETPFTQKNVLGIAIAGSSLTRERGQRHVALVYKQASRALVMLHLGWNKTLLYQRWEARHYSWIEMDGIDPDVQELFCDWAEIVAISSRTGIHPIPYSAFFRPTGNFDASGNFVNMQDGSGLTCSTFILALFSDYKLPLIDAASWPARIEDARWFRKIWGKLRRIDPILSKIDLILQFKRRRQLRRFRPEEVLAAGSLYSGSELNFASVSQRVSSFSTALPR